MRWVRACGLGVLSILPAPLGADGQAPFTDRHSFLVLATGDSVRLRIPGALPVDASMRAVHADTLVLTVTGLADSWSLSAFDLESLERYVDRTPREGFRHGAVMGMAFGLFAGAATGVILQYTGVLGPGGDDDLRDVIAASLKGMGIGAGIGVMAGGFVGGAHPGMGWITIDLPTLPR